MEIALLLNVIFAANLISQIMAINELENDFEYDFSLFGVVCSLKEYQVAYYINKLLSLDLEKIKDDEVENKRGGKLVFSMFMAQTDSSDIRLIKNKAVESFKVTKPFFLPELKEFDYFLQIHGELHDWYENEITELLKEVNQIQYIKQLEVENIDLKENLIY